LNKFLLVKAEIKSIIERNAWGAVQLYEDSIDAAQKNGFVHEYALSNERAAACMLREGKKRFVNQYLDDAYSAYKEWGALTKLDGMKKQYKGVQKSSQSQWERGPLSYNYPSGISQQLYEGHKQTNRTNTLTLSLALFDIESIFRASQTISSTIDMDQLLHNIMKIICETAGATSAAIIIDRYVQSESVQQFGSMQENISTMCNIPVSSWERGCTAIVDYVSRTLDTVVLNDVQNDRLYGVNPYIIRSNTKSVLCMPVVHQGTLKAILYVENNLITDCFTMERVNILSILTGQMAISIENSLYFKKQIKAMEEITEIQTERVKEAELYQKKQEEFIDRICHEIRNPIQGVMGNCDLSKEIISQVQHNYRDDKFLFNLCAKYQKIVTDDVLTLSKLEFGQVKLQNEIFSVPTIIDEVLCIFETAIFRKQISLKRSIEQNDSFSILYGDPNRISQILINLISNALKFTDNGYISVSCSYVALESSKVKVTIAVKDTGCGMTPEESQHVFNRFEQVVQRTNSEYTGSGLGLFIAKNLVELMGGGIYLESEKSIGTTVTFYVICEHTTDEERNKFLTKKKFAKHNKASISSGKEGHKMPLHVLVVEDNKINQKILVKHIQQLKCSCSIANDGIEALEMFKKENYDIIFMDVSMPRMDGYECTQKIRKLGTNSSKSVMIIGLSGNARQEYHDKGLESGMNYFLTKPIKLSDVSRVILEYSDQ
jgi:signal transduction histidine kinase/CheY-like chemotaxis protein